jgi:hypothetical protein
MKNALIALLLSFAAAVSAQDAKTVPQEKNSGETKKLGSVTWNLETHKLTWVVTKGTTVNGKFVPSSEDKYEIVPDDATMAFLNEKRGFTEEEATSLHHLLDVLSLYCAESVVWWDQGQGTPIDDSTPAVPGKHPGKNLKPVKPGDKPTKVAQPERKQKPADRGVEGEMVASAGGMR